MSVRNLQIGSSQLRSALCIALASTCALAIVLIGIKGQFAVAFVSTGFSFLMMRTLFADATRGTRIGWHGGGWQLANPVPHSVTEKRVYRKRECKRGASKGGACKTETRKERACEKSESREAALEDNAQGNDYSTADGAFPCGNHEASTRAGEPDNHPVDVQAYNLNFSWVVYVAYRFSSGRPGANVQSFWIFCDSVDEQTYRCLRAQLTLTPTSTPLN